MSIQEWMDGNKQEFAYTPVYDVAEKVAQAIRCATHHPSGTVKISEEDYTPSMAGEKGGSRFMSLEILKGSEST